MCAQPDLYDPLVMVHARALLTGTPDGVTAYAKLDMHDPQFLLRISVS